jgi:hypothetical protein
MREMQEREAKAQQFFKLFFILFLLLSQVVATSKRG